VNERQRHWEQVYAGKSSTGVSWYQPSAERSLALIKATGIAPDAAVIDIGGGASVLVDQLLEAGFSDVTVLDLAASGLALSKARLGPRAGQVHWIEADLLSWTPDRAYGLWHDRAVFHFLTGADERARYRANLKNGLAKGGWLIMAAFSPDGPERCSGLPVQRWSPETLAAELGPEFLLVESFREAHRTPGGAMQNFIWCRFRRDGSPK
jgi:Methyltransferase domain